MRRKSFPGVDLGFIPDVVTDQTSAHDELNGYVPAGMPYEEALTSQDDPRRYVEMALDSMAVHCRAILDMQKRGAVAFDYGNNLRGQALNGESQDAFAYPGFVPAYIRPLFCEGEGPFGGLPCRAILRTSRLRIVPSWRPSRIRSG